MNRGFELIVATFAVVLIAPAAPAEMYRWVDAQGRVHFSDQPVEGAQNVELDAQIQVQEPADGTTAEVIERARAKRREVQRWADRESRTAARRNSATVRKDSRQRFQQVMPRPGGQDRVLAPDQLEKSRERECLSSFGKPCGEIDNWKQTATEDCRRRNLSQDCESDAYLSKRRPRTLEEQGRIDAKRQKREDRRWKKAEREIEALRHR